MYALSVSWRDFPEGLISRWRLDRRVIRRAPEADREIRFAYRDPEPLIPAYHGSTLCVYPWAGHVKREDLEAGLWRELEPEEVDIPAALGYARGVWYHVRQGFKGVWVAERHAGEEGEVIREKVYLQTTAATHYWQVMTGLKRMPVLIEQTI